jgi:anti-sigma regulatory factor (Ser/Thr protein kinase)
MRSGAAAGATGYFHEAAFYGSDDELLALVVPFLQEGVDAGEPVVVTFADRNAALVRAVFGPDDGITFLPGADQYARPALAIRQYQALFAALVGEGAEQIRVVGDVPHPGTGGRWDEWVRYEGLVTSAYDAFPVWGLCPYDTRTAPEDVLADVYATHPHVATLDGHHVNAEFRDPAAVVVARRPEPLPEGVPNDALLSPSAAEARRSAGAAGDAAGLDRVRLGDLVLIASELVTNAHAHGRPPVTMELWTGPGRVLLAVTDAGAGPADPFAGLQDPGLTPDGRGLWLTHQLADAVGHHRNRDSFTISAAVAHR